MDRSASGTAVRLLVSVMLLAMPAPVNATTYDLTGATVYSDLCTDRLTGDTNGLRVFVRRPDQTPRVVAQLAEGGLTPPIEAPSKIIDGRLRFVVPGDIPEATFTGVVFDGYLVVRSAKRGSKPFRLNAVKGHSRFPRCR